MNGRNWIEGCIVVWWITRNLSDLFSFLLLDRHRNVCMDMADVGKGEEAKKHPNFNVPIWVKATIFCLNSFSIKILFFQIGITDEIDWHGNIQCGNLLNHMENGYKTNITLSWIAITQKSGHMWKHEVQWYSSRDQMIVLIFHYILLHYGRKSVCHEMPRKWGSTLSLKKCKVHLPCVCPWRKTHGTVIIWLQTGNKCNRRNMYSIIQQKQISHTPFYYCPPF